VLSLPAAALGRLPQLKRLKADYNRIGALSYEILRSLKGIEELSLAYNIIREIPEGTFRDLSSLKILNLYGNKIAGIDPNTFAGTEANLEYLDLGFNIISEVVTDISFPSLKYLNLAKNKLTQIEGAFNLLSHLNVLVLRENAITKVSAFTFTGMDNLISIDLSKNFIRELEPGVFGNNYLNEVNMSGNLLKELEQETFVNLPILEVLDLSHNNLIGIQNGAFDTIPRLKKLYLHHNKMSSYKGDFFANMGNDTDLYTLDLSYNELTYLYPESFIYHPQLREVDFAHNKFSFFPTQFIRGLKYLKSLKLNNNLIKTIDDGDFANLPMLTELDLCHNELVTVSETAFQNSTQLQMINLSHNQIAMLKTDTFLGVIRLLLDLSHNNLTDMPRGIFERPKVMKLEKLDLSHNKFSRIPVHVLQSQYFYLDTLKISNNMIRDIPSDANILVNIKEIDLSYNPLTEDSIINVLNEPKTVRKLNMAGTGIEIVPILETPFLTHLNLSDNSIDLLNEEILNKPSLHTLDVSYNNLPNLSFGMSTAWPKLRNLKYLDISGNPISFIIKGDFKYLNTLQVLKMSHLYKCTKVETGAFENLKALKVLEMYDLPMVMFMDIRGILSNFQTLEEVIVDFKESLVGNHLSPAYSPRLKKLGVKGSKVKNIAIGAFAGISSSNIEIMLKDTKISNIPTAIFFPVPMSSHIKLDVKGSRLSSLGPQLLNTLDSKQRHIRLEGLGTNPIYCDCNARALQRWLREKAVGETLYGDLAEVRCAAPDVLAGKLLADLPEEELTCEGRTTTTTTELEFLAANVTTTPYPDIITYSAAEEASSTRAPKPNLAPRQPLPTKAGSSGDALIIGIVGGVVAFIAIIIIIICIVRLRLTDSQYRGGPLAGPLALRAQGKCTCLKPVPPTLYGAASMGHLPGALSYPSTPVPHPHHPHHPQHALALTWGGPPGNGTVNSSKMAPPASSIHGGSAFGTVGAHSYMSAGTVVSRGSHHPISYPGTLTPAGYPATPYYVTFPADSDGEGHHGHVANGRHSGHR
jgi:Leucine-rich repeat (LRR) protein